MSLYSITEQGKERPWAPITFPLPADVENEIMEETAERIKNEVWADIEKAFPEFRLPTSKQATAQKRLDYYTAQIAEVDYPLFRDPQYLKKYKAGVYPILQSPFLLDLMTIPPVFLFVQKDFIRLTNWIDEASDE